MLRAVADQANEFSWSRTRDNIFQECRRRYYLHYYGSWGGWEPGADPAIRALYVLKQLGTRYMWAGRLVHEAVERTLQALRDGHGLSEASLIEDTVRQMRQEWKGSRDGVYRETPKRPGLFEHEYGVPVRAGEWQALREHVVRCLRNFHRMPLLADIKRTPVERWIFLEDIGSFPWEGTRIFTAPDSDTGAGTIAYSSSTGRRAAPVRAPRSSSAATPCTPSRSSAWTWRASTCWR